MKFDLYSMSVDNWKTVSFIMVQLSRQKSKIFIMN